MTLMSRYFCMPNGDTFSMKPVAEFIERNIDRGGLVVDPFARNSSIADITNDLNPNTSAQFHMGAVDFLKTLSGRTDISSVLFDPPYSPRQITECYKEAGLTATMKDTQNARFYKECRDVMKLFLFPGDTVISFGWNSIGIGIGWYRLETMLVYHGGAHNDTICCADRMMEPK